MKLLTASDIAAAAKILQASGPVDCIVVDSELSTSNLDDLMGPDEECNDGVCTRLPLVVHSADGSEADDAAWKRLANTVHDPSIVFDRAVCRI